MISDKKFWIMLGTWTGIATAIFIAGLVMSAPAKAGGFDPTPVQQYGLNGSWFYKLAPEDPVIAGNGFSLEVSYNEFNQPILVAYWFRVSDVGIGPAKGGATLMLSWSGTGNFQESNRVSNLLFLTASPDCEVNEPCGSYLPLGTAEFIFQSCTEATMTLDLAKGGGDTLYLIRGTPPQMCGAE